MRLLLRLLNSRCKKILIDKTDEKEADNNDKDKDKDPSARSDRGLKKRKKSKDVEPTKGPKTKKSKSGSSKGTKSQSKSSRKSIHAEELEFETPQQGPTQSWLMTLASSADKPSKTFDELMSTPIDFSTYIMNGLKITNLTQETLLGSAFKLLKGTRTNFAELEYDFEECYKALSEKLDWDNLEGGDYPFDLTKPSLYTANVHQKHGYSKETRRSSTGSRKLPEEDQRHQARNYQTQHQERDPYTPYQDPQGFIYVDNQGRNRLMRSDELYKFSDGTLTRIQTSLDDITKNIRREYLPQRRWSLLEKKRAHIMIKDIDN
ncbi:hypothetical protein Tco_0256272 [Tanacetum coccineum]